MRLFLLQSLPARSDCCRGRIPQPWRPARALAIKRGAVPMPIDRSGEITLSIYADGPSAMYSDLRPSWPTRDSTFDRSRRNTKRRDHNNLFVLLPFLRRRLRVNAAGGARPPSPNLLQHSWSWPRPWTWVDGRPWRRTRAWASRCRSTRSEPLSIAAMKPTDGANRPNGRIKPLHWFFLDMTRLYLPARST